MNELMMLQSPAPGPYVREMLDAGMFYSNRVLKDFKEKYSNLFFCVKDLSSDITA